MPKTVSPGTGHPGRKRRSVPPILFQSWRCYALPFVLVAAVVLSTRTIPGDQTHLFLLLGVVVVVAWLRGAAPAMTAVFLGTIAGVFLPLMRTAPPEIAALSWQAVPFFSLLGIAIALLTHRLERSRDELANADQQTRILEEELGALRQQAYDCERLNDEVRRSEERYRAFIGNSSEAIFLFEAEKVSTDLPVDEQIRLIYETAHLTECNSAMAELYGYASPEEIIGVGLGTLMPPSEPRNIELLRAFIGSGYRLTDIESAEQDRHGKPLVLLNNLIGIVENGFLLRGWGTSRDITAQRQNEEAVRQSEERFRLSAQAVRAVIYEWNVATGEVVRSGGLEEVVGYSPDDVPATTDWWVALIHPEDVGAGDKLRQAIASGTSAFSMEYRVRHRNGRWVHLWDRGLVVCDAEGRPLRVHGSSLDITEQVESRRRMEEMAAAAELHFRQLEGVFQSMNEGVAVYAPNGHVISINTAMMRIHGFEPGEDYGLCVDDLSGCVESRLPDGTRPTPDSLPSMRALHGEEVSDWEVEVRRIGKEKYATVSYNATPVRNSKGEVVLAVATARDITEQKRAQTALRESELQYRTVTDTVPCMVFTIVPESGLDFCNREWYEYTGFSVEQTLGYGWLAAIHPDEREETIAAWAQCHVTGAPLELESRVRAADGTYRWFLGRGHALRNEAGKIAKWFGTATDIEDRKQAEANIRVANEQLAAARDEAVEANRAKSAFLANMSHELRTPLSAIIGYAEMMQEEARESGYAETLQDLGNITTAGRHLLALINDLLDLAKVEAGRMELEPCEFNIAQLVTEVVDTSMPLARAKNNEMVLDCPSDLGSMIADPRKVRQSLINLISNACKFTEKGRVELTVNRRCIDNANWIEFRISDNGIGIDPDQLDLIFSEFVQADAASTRKQGGTGLGLTITRRFCRMMGGDVTAESEPGHGSVFTMRLPV